MAARVFSPMARVFARTFREAGTHWWQRHDADAPVAIDLIFQEFPEEVDADGFRVQDPTPVAIVTVAHALALAPERAAVDRRQLFDSRDTLTIAGRAWRVESCSIDGLGMCTVKLNRDGI